MPAFFGQCDPCRHCENLAGECTKCIQCLPRFLCVTAKIDFGVGVEGCCDTNTLEFVAKFACENNWSGKGKCGKAVVNLGITLVINEKNLATVDITINGDLISGLGISCVDRLAFTFSHTDTATGYHYTFTISPAKTKLHPFIHDDCAPCICTRCLPEKFCVTIGRVYGTASPNASCINCFDSVKLVYANCAYTGKLVCGLTSYLVTIKVDKSECKLVVTVVGGGVNLTFDILLESKLAVGTGGCFECRDPSLAPGVVPPPLVARVGSKPFADCGVVNVTDMTGAVTILIGNFPTDAEKDTFTVSVSPLWCDEKCLSKDSAACCFGFLRAMSVPDCGSIIDLRMEVIGCANWETGQHVGLGLPDVCITSSGSLGIQYTHPDAPFDPIDIRLICTIPTECTSLLEGEFPAYLRMVFRMAGDCIGDYCFVAKPTYYSCNPFFAEFVVPMPPHNGLHVIAPDCLFCTGDVIFRFTL